MNQLKSIAHRMMTERGLLPDFSPAALLETRALIDAPPVTDASVRDLRKLLWASIDNDSSRDLDQLSVAEPMADGAVKILVAIADVDALVKRRSAIDDHAEQNTTTVYTAAGIFPMLPEPLSTDLTSLGQGQDRLAMVIEMVVDANGTMKSSDVYRATVHNHAKLAYNSVAAWLDGKAEAPAPLAAVAGLDEQIRIQDRTAQALRAQRFSHGALALHTPQAEAVFVGDKLTDLKPAEANRAKELIEDFMVASNGVVARFLAQKGFAVLKRLLRSPERWARIVGLAHDVGAKLPSEPSGEALSEFLANQREKNPDGFDDLSLAVVKLLGRGEYVMELPQQPSAGHFGLAVSDYTHSTAPNRRFPDLVTQRLLKAAIAGNPAPYTNEELGGLAPHCNEQMADAEKVSRQIDKAAAAMLLQSRIGEVFDAFVTGASDKGTWVRINRPVTEGRLMHPSKGLDVGDRVRVKLVRTDINRGFIDFESQH
ncbi:MAG: RNB domain-containing ribonuclease [Vicinamibacteria bacterium]